MKQPMKASKSGTPTATSTTSVSTNVALAKCQFCKNDLSPAKKECLSCGQDNGYPNVRLAESTAEINALSKRVADAEASTKARGCLEILDGFGRVVLTSHAVISRSLAVIENLLASDTNLFTNYQNQLAQGARIPENNEFDTKRIGVEAAISPPL